LSDRTDHPPLPQAFADLGVRNSILKGLAEANFVTPSEIQSLLIPVALTGVDILGQARTGTGKTAAFGIPILQRVERGLSTQAIILVPTRELAIQVEEEIRRLAKHTPIRIVSVVGGQRIASQARALDHHPELVVGTPGRVMDLLERRILSFQNVRYVVLDEVDRMLDIGFRDDIRKILAKVRDASKRMQSDAGPATTPPAGEGDPDDQYGPIEGVQTIFVSATISDEIDRLARKYMREPVSKLIAPGADEKPTVDKIEQAWLSVDPWDKTRLLRFMLDREQPDLAIVFTRTKHGAEHLADALRAAGIDCKEIHGNLRQNKRDTVMKGLRSHKFEVLVATDLASRGIDVAGISHIFNFDVPEDPEVYVHRIGRTARMGAEGKAFTFILRDQGHELTKIENLINMEIRQIKPEGWEPRPPRENFIPAAPKAPPPPSIQPAPAGKKLTIGSKIKRTRRR
jgi:ATP-dependent RNA helicase DeaD